MLAFMNEPPDGPKLGKRMGRLKRVLYGLLVLLVVFLLLAWAFLPRIAEIAIRNMIADAGMERSEFRVTEVGWRRMAIERVNVSQDFWGLRAREVVAHYDFFDLLDGELQSVEVIGGAFSMDLLALEALKAEGGDENDLEEASSSPSELLDEFLVSPMQKVRDLEAVDFLVELRRGENIVTRQVTLKANDGGHGRPSLSMTSDAFSLSASQANSSGDALWQTLLTIEDTASLIKVVEFAMGAEEAFLPEGVSMSRVKLTHALESGRAKLQAYGSISIGGNEVPFSYSHEQEFGHDAWSLVGRLKVEVADLKEPVADGAMLVEAMAGMTIAGKVSLMMDFTVGSEKDFDGALAASLTEGRLTMGDDGPVLEGLSGDIHLSSLKEIKTDGFHQVTAEKITAFDAEMTDLQLEYKILAGDGISLREIAVKALGGAIQVDPFVLPSDDADYQFNVQMKELDLAELAKLFPSFNGSVKGKVDGLLPIRNVAGEFRPVRGGLYLTPKSNAELRYDIGNTLSAGVDPKTEEYKRMKMAEDSLRNLDLKELNIRLFDPKDGDKAIVIKLKGQAASVPGSPPIHLNVNGIKPDDDTLDFFDLLLKHRDKLNFGL